MVDVSAQASCTITPINPTTLTTAGGALPNGIENVMIRCSCSDDGGSVITNARWYKPDMNLVPRLGTNSFIAGAPHFTRASGYSGNSNVTLVIPTFNDSYDGNYICGRRNTNANNPPLPPLPPTATVSLIVGGKLFITYAYT